MLSFRLFLTEQNRAALNLYATRPAAFTDQSVATGAMFAAYASMALLAAARHDTANHLLRALETNREIGVAMEILMVTGHLTQDQAFDQLRTASQTLNRKLHDIAADVTATGQLPPRRAQVRAQVSDHRPVRSPGARSSTPRPQTAEARASSVQGAVIAEQAARTACAVTHRVRPTGVTEFGWQPTASGVFVQLSGVLKRIAVKLSKICNDLRLLSSGPTAGLGEINLPPVQAGSSIMPGKVNPVIPEVVNQIAFQVVGNDVTVSFAAEAGQLQLNAFEPIILATLTQSIKHLREGCRTLATHCVSGITANTAHLKSVVEASIGLVTALSPHIGYEQSSAIAADALLTRRPVTELVLERQLLSPQRLAELLTPANLVHPTPAPE